MSTCAKCDEGFCSSDVIAVCSICNDLYHANSAGKNCSGCSASEIKVLEFKKKKPVMVYRCYSCTSTGGEDVSLKELVADLQKTIKKLPSFLEDVKIMKNSIPVIKSDINAIKGKSEEHSTELSRIRVELAENKACIELYNSKVVLLEGSVEAVQASSSAENVDTSALFQELANEFDNRRYRENNIILRNVQDDVDLRPEVDADTVSNVLAKIKNLKTVFSKKNVSRLGAYNKDKCRPISVRMVDHNDVTTVLTHWKLIEGGINVSADLTKNQRSAYNDLKSKAKVFNSAHADDSVKQIVKFVHGNPKLITINRNRNKNDGPNASVNINSTANNSRFNKNSKNM